MQMRHVFLVLWARFVPLIAVILATVMAATLVSLVLPHRYNASATLVIDSSRVDPVTGLQLHTGLGNDYLNTQKEIVGSYAVALKVVRDLKLSDGAETREDWLQDTDGQGTIDDWLANALLKKLKVELGRENSVISVEFTSSSAERAAEIANAFAQAYLSTNLELRVTPARETARWFAGQLANLKNNLERAQSRLSEYQRAMGVTSTDERLDVENTRLSELSQQLVLAQSAAIDASSRKRQLDQYVKEGRNPEALPDAIGNTLINDLKRQLSVADAKLIQLAGQLGRNHPEYQKSSAEVEQLRRQLTVELETLASGIGNTARVAQAKEGDLRSALAAQKTRVLELNRSKGRDELALLMKEVEFAQKSYDTASQRSHEATMESQISQAYAAVLSPAVPPLEPSFPNWPLNLALSIMLGTMLGVAVAFMMEQADRRVRSQEDLAYVRDLPLLGVLGLGTSPRRLRSSMMRRFSILSRFRRPEVSRGVSL